MVRPEGFEPTTYGFGDRHSIQLSYGRFAGLILQVVKKRRPTDHFRPLPSNGYTWTLQKLP